VSFDEDALRRWCREKIGPARTPRKIAVMEEIPRGPTGKIQRRELKRMLDAGELRFEGQPRARHSA
jgi:acyl-coenzyme A synthetase/AMP-(fatty) acid ligase